MWNCNLQFKFPLKELVSNPVNAILSLSFTMPVFGWGKIGWVGRFRRKRASTSLPRESEFSYLCWNFSRGDHSSSSLRLPQNTGWTVLIKILLRMTDSVLRSLFSHPDRGTNSYPIVLPWDSNEIRKVKRNRQGLVHSRYTVSDLFLLPQPQPQPWEWSHCEHITSSGSYHSSSVFP